MSNASMTVEAGRYTHGEVDEVAYAAFVARAIRENKRAVAKGRGVWAGKSEADAIEAAEMYCRCYRHQFRRLVPIEPR